MITDEEFEKLKQEYYAGKIQIGVELSLARKNMNQAGNKTSIIWFASFTIAMLLSFALRDL